MSILALTSDTLIGTAAAGNIEYNGQFFGTDSNASRAQMQRIAQGTAVASTSGTSINFTSLPAWVKKITVIFNGVGTSGTVGYLIQIGSGSVTSSGYVGGGNRLGSSTGVPATSTAGFLINSGASGGAKNGSIAIKLMNTTFGYVADGVLFSSSEPNQYLTAGAVTLSGVLDRVRITTTNGTDTFSAGSINIMYEG